jgi:pilus assembly protein CpaD
MTTNRILLALTLATSLLLGACAPVTSYSESEAPKRLTLDTAVSHVDLHFAPGTAQLVAADALRLHHLAATGAISPADRVTVAATGGPALAEQRIGSVAAVLLHYGIVIAPDQLADVPPNHVIVEISRTLVTLPACPNWSKPSSSDFGNAPSSNFGCTTETNLGLMVANPSDLASGRPSAGSAGQPAASAVNRYLNDKVVLPTANTALPIATQNSASPSSSPSSTGSQ